VIHLESETGTDLYQLGLLEAKYALRTKAMDGGVQRTCDVPVKQMLDVLVKTASAG
jgi:hypothetical protein